MNTNLNPFNNNHRRFKSQIITSPIIVQNTDSELKYRVKNNFHNRVNTITKDLFFDSFSEIKEKNQMMDNSNLNSADNSIMETNNNELLNNMYGNRSSNKFLVKVVINKFHDLYMKLINKYKKLKIENNNVKKKMNMYSTDFSKENKTGNLNFHFFIILKIIISKNDRNFYKKFTQKNNFYLQYLILFPKKFRYRK